MSKTVAIYVVIVIFSFTAGFAVVHNLITPTVVTAPLAG